MNKKRILKVLIPILALIMILAGCSTDSSNTDVTASSVLDTSDMFTDRDLRTEYDESESETITLNGDSATSDSDNVEIDGSTVTITGEGIYVISGELENGMIKVDATDSDKIQLVLNGVDINNDTSAAIYVVEANKVFVTTADGTENTLTNGGEYEQIDDNNIDAVIFSKSDLTLNGAGTLNITAKAGHGVVSKDDLVLTSGTYVIDAASHGLSGKDSVRIADGTYTITAGKDAIQASNTEDEDKGFVYIQDGKLTINADDDGVHASYALVIDGGTVNVAKSYEGLEGLVVEINDGTINVVASDDGINSAGGNDSSGGNDFAATEGALISINGGSTHINADGDGIDSNGDIEVTGGETYVSGSTNNGNGALDYAGSANITGGTFVATGMSGMAQSFSESTQGVIAISDSGSADGTITITDSSGNEIGSWTADKEFDCVVISTPDIEEGETYTIDADGSETSVTMDSLQYSNISGGMGGGMMQGPDSGDSSSDGKMQGPGSGDAPHDGGGMKQGGGPSQ